MSKTTKKPAAKKALTPGRISKLASNPGTRAALADKYLNPQQLKARQLNQRLNAPVTDGSSLTNRELAHQRDSAVQVQYGPDDQALKTKLGQSQQLTKDTAGWYQQYQDSLNKLKTDVSNSNTVQNAANTNMVGAVGQLGAQTAVGTGDVRADADKASAVRQALSGSFGAMMAAKGGNQANYAANLADVVGPGQKLSALNQSAKSTGSVQDQIAALAREKGAFGQKFMADTVAAEQKNVLANKALEGTQSNQQAQQATDKANIDIKRGVDPVTGKALPKKPASASDKKTAADLAYFKKHGYYPPTGPPKSAKDPKGKSPYLGTSGQNSFKNDLATTKATVGKLSDQYSRNELRGLLQTGRAAQTVYVDKDGKVLPDVTDLTTAHKQGGHAVKVPAIPKMTNDAALSAALDAIYDGHLSAATIKKLHAAGIKVNGLGVSTKRPSQTTTVVSNTMSDVGQLLGGIGK